MGVGSLVSWEVYYSIQSYGTQLWVSTPKFDMATWPFLKIDMVIS